ncbi:predicted protein [Uncinocarpus reesii 1704]|uniref:Uncharacterized protein n=1 Tax=Uncinocarpus reesii (strain UAMH 1704) TaxID=336963 RepID=C4JX94_UNCRE|nr:uncharacterized protein UREG_06267 [Uncinocarpus reesii 1704]EEP81402.1 predicted protein [Uncinocarpus reesii 1704]
MSSFTAINHPGVVDPAAKGDDIEATTASDVPDIKAEENEEENMAQPEPKGKKAKETKVPTTPRKRGRKPAVKKEASAIKTENSDDDTKEHLDEDSPQKKAKSTPGKKGRPIPTSYDAACEEDKMLLRLKDQENKTWAEIASAWKEMTGEAAKGTTLSTRYMRIKANFIVLSKEDEAALLKVKKEIEDKFESEKWQRLAEALEQASGKKFPPLTLQKKFKELDKKGVSDEIF